MSVTYTTKQKVVLYIAGPHDCFSRFDDVTLETHVVGAEFPNKESVGSIPVEKQLTFCLMSSVALQVPRSHELCNNPYSPLALTNPNR